jgi:hypothetical protein
VARKQIELATCSLRQITVKLWKFLLTSVDLDVVSLGSTENVQTIFELLPCSVEHVRWNSRDRIPDTVLQVIKSSVGGKKKLPELHCNLPQTECG